jgi:hypothetical protein
MTLSGSSKDDPGNHGPAQRRGSTGKTIRPRWLRRRTSSPWSECSSRNSYGASGVLVTEFRKKIFFFCSWTTPPCLTRRPDSISLRDRNAGQVVTTPKSRRCNRLGSRADNLAAMHHEIQFSAARVGFSFAICFTVACNSSAVKEGNEQMRLLQAKAAGSPRSGYSTSGLGNLPSRRSSHSRRL